MSRRGGEGCADLKGLGVICRKLRLKERGKLRGFQGSRWNLGSEDVSGTRKVARILW